MNFIEQVFGIAPDAGSGALELGLVLAVLLIVTVGFIVRMRANRAR